MPSSKQEKTTPTPTLYFAYGSNLSTTQMAARCPESTLVGVGELVDYTWVINSRGYANVVHESRLSTSSANVVESRPKDSALSFHDPPLATSSSSSSSSQKIWGLLYALPSEDEARLDLAEGVPGCYGKEWLSLRFWPLDVSESHAPSAAAALFKDVRDPFMPTEGQEAITDHVAEEARRSQIRDAPRSSEAEKKAVVPDGKADPNQKPKHVTALVYVDRQRVTKGEIQQEYVMRMRRGCAECEERGVPKEWLDEVIRPWLK